MFGQYTLRVVAWNAYANLLFGIVLNGLLLFLAKRCSSLDLRNFRPFIYYLSALCISMLLVQTLLQPSYLIGASFSFMYGQGILTKLNFLWLHYILANLYILLLNQTIISVALKFLDRYLIICRSGNLRTALAGSLSIAFAIPMIFGEIIAPPDTELPVRQLPDVYAEMSGMEGMEELKIALKYDTNTLPSKITGYLTIICMLLLYFTIIFSFLKIRVFLKRNITDNNLASRKETIQQISKNMVLQGLLPICCLVGAILAIGASMYGKYYATLVELEVLLFVPFNWLPTLNPLITIWTIAEYRRGLLKLLRIGNGGNTNNVMVLSSSTNAKEATDPARIFAKPAEENL